MKWKIIPQNRSKLNRPHCNPQSKSLRLSSFLFLLQEDLDEAEALVVDLHAVVVEPADAAQEHEQLLARLLKEKQGFQLPKRYEII